MSVQYNTYTYSVGCMPSLSILSTDLRSSAATDHREGLRRFVYRLTDCHYFVNMPETRHLDAQPNLRKTSHE